MKIIHTSDWHLGHQLYNFDREEEQLNMLRQLEMIVSEERPDALLVSGDIFHTVQPSASVQKLFSDSLVRIHTAWPSMYIIVTAGNHDSGAKHEIFQTPWRALNVYMLGHIDKEDPAQHIIRVGDKGLVIAVPYVNQRNLPENYFESLLEMAKAENKENLPIVVMAHTTVAGIDWTGHEDANNLTVGGIDAMPLEMFGTGYDYLALGHIHRPQWVDGDSGRIRYSGTPLPVSFDETFCHSVSVVEIAAAGQKATVKERGIENLYPLISLPLSGAADWDEVKKTLSEFSPERAGSYLRLLVKVEDFLPSSATMEAQRLAENCGCKFCYIHTTRSERQQTECQALNVDEFQREAPEDIAKRFASETGIVWDDEMSSMFKEVLNLVNEEERS